MMLEDITWKMCLSLENGTKAIIQATEMQSIASNGSRRVWKGCSLLGNDFEVAASFQEEEGGALLCNLSWTPDRRITEVQFPIVERPYPQESVFVSGLWNTGLRRMGDTRWKPGEHCRLHCQSMQFSALLDAANGSLHIEHRDSQWFFKALDIDCSADGGRLTLSPVFFVPIYPEGKPQCGSIPYPTALIPFAGADWFDSVSIYRKWAWKQSWCRTRHVAGEMPQTDLWIWNRGAVADVREPVLRMAETCRQAGLSVTFIWYWWHNNPYDSGYPDFWPPRDSEEEFASFVSELRAAGVFTLVYVNGTCWDLDYPGWEDGGSESVVVCQDGTQWSWAFNVYNHHRLGFVCGGAPKFADKLSRLLKTLRGHGLDAQYLDIIGCATDFCCWNPEHGHPLNGGNYTVEGYRGMLKRLGEENPGYPIVTECANEAYMDVTAGAFVCSGVSPERIGLAQQYPPIPLFPAVYHGKYMLFGNYACPDGIPPWDRLWPTEDRWKQERPWHKLYPHSFFLEFARTVLWGVEPMICNVRDSFFNNLAFADSLAFTLEGAAFRKRHLDFLGKGTMLPPPPLECDSLEVVFFQRMIFTREEEAAEIKTRQPGILHSAWEAEDGRRMLFLVNYTPIERSWKCVSRSGTIPPYSFQAFSL